MRFSSLFSLLLALAAPAVAQSVLGDTFLRLDRGRPGPAALAPETQRVAVYYGASWCGPCRAFVPELIAAYPRLRAAGVEVVFVSDDATCRAGHDYARTSRMPWLILPCDERRQAGLRALGGAALPGLVLVDGDGNLRRTSWDAQGRSEPRRMLRTLLDDSPVPGRRP